MLADEEKLTQYALGILEDAEQKKMQRRIATSPQLQKELVIIRESLKNMAFAEKPICPSDRLRQVVLNSIHEKNTFDGFVERFSSLFDLENQVSHNLLNKISHISDSVWESTVFPGVTIMKFNGGPKVASATCGIVQVKPGKLFPAHQHQGEERNLVLQGFARDDNDKVYAPGDQFILSAGSKHSFRIVGDETFIFAVVLLKDNKWLWFKTLIDFFRIKK